VCSLDGAVFCSDREFKGGEEHQKTCSSHFIENYSNSVYWSCVIIVHLFLASKDVFEKEMVSGWCLIFHFLLVVGR
jgi:hypothetical protein